MTMSYMIDKEKLQQRISGDQQQEPSSMKKTFSGLTIAELLTMKAEIEAYLPSTSIMDLNLEGELLMQYAQTKELLNLVIGDEAVPANQKSQIINSCSAILSNLTKSQTELYNGERIKIMEQCLINALKSLPDDVSDRFFEAYARELKVLD
mgnify:CR=1 FL=1